MQSEFQTFLEDNKSLPTNRIIEFPPPISNSEISFALK